MIMTFHGFIVPGEGLNFATFDPSVILHFQVENTGDATPDLDFAVRFGPISLIKGSSTLGLYCETRRGTQTVKPDKKGGFSTEAPFLRVDRVGNPAINVALIAPQG